MYNSSNMFNNRDLSISDISLNFGNSGFNVNSSVNGYPRSNSAMFSNNFNYLNNGDNINYSQPANNNLSFRTFQYNNNVNNLTNVSNYLNNYPCYNSVNFNQQINNIPNNYSNIYGNNFTTPQNIQSYSDSSVLLMETIVYLTNLNQNLQKGLLKILERMLLIMKKQI